MARVLRELLVDLSWTLRVVFRPVMVFGSSIGLRSELLP